MLRRIGMPFLLAGLIAVYGFTQVKSIKLLQTKYSKKAVRLVLNNMGKKVGSGTSLALLKLYEKKSKAKTALKFSLGTKTLPYIAVGDELYFSGTYTDNNVNSTVVSTQNYSGPMHYAIVVGLKDDNTLMIAHQNVNEGSPQKAVLLVTELKVDDPSRSENINVYGLWPEKGNVKPESVIRKTGKVYEISPVRNEKNDYFVESNFTK